MSSRPIPHRRMSLTDPRHLMRFLKAQAQGGTTAEAAAVIAKSEGVSISTVKHSINQVDCYRKQNSGIEMELAIRNVVISTAPKLTETLHGLLDATELVEIPNPNNGKKKIVSRPDKTTRLEAGRLVKDLMIGLQPKGPMIEQTINQTNQVATLSSGVETTEERFKRLRQQAAEHNLLPPEVSGVPQHIDREEDEEDEDDSDDDTDEA